MRKREGRKEREEGRREKRKERWKISLLATLSRYGIWLNFLKSVTQVILEHCQLKKNCGMR